MTAVQACTHFTPSITTSQCICATEIIAIISLPLWSMQNKLNAEDSRLSLWGLNSPLSLDQWQLVERYWQLVERGLVEREVLHWQQVVHVIGVYVL